MTKAKKSTEEKIQSCLTRLQKLVVQYYKENPETLDSREGDREQITFYGSAVVGIDYNEYDDCFQSVASITVSTKTGYKDIESSINHKPMKGGKNHEGR